MAGKRGNGEGSIYARCPKCRKTLTKATPQSRLRCPECGGNDALWVGAVSVGHRLDGKPDRRTVYGHSRDEVKGKVVELLTAVNDGKPPDVANLTVAQFLAKWLAARKASVELKTWMGYEQHCRRHIIPAIGHLQLAAVKPMHFEDLSQAMVAAGLSARTAHHTHRVAHTAFEQAVRWELIGRNPVAGAEPPSPRGREMMALDFDQSRRFLATLAGERLGALYATAIMTAFREGELCGLRWSDVNWAERAIVATQTVWYPGTVTEGRPEFKPRTKTGKPRRVPMAEPLMQILRAHQDRQRFERQAAGDEWQDYGLVFTRPDGQPLRVQNVISRLRKILTAAGLPPVRFHDLRHSCATLLIGLGVDIKTVSAILGHANTSITVNLYGHLLPGSTEKAVSDLSRALFGAPNSSSKPQGLPG